MAQQSNLSQSVAMELFKYCNQYGKLMLENLEIKVTPPNELNDPCEMRPVVKVRDARVWAEQQVKQALTSESFFNRNRHQIAPGLTFAEFKLYGSRAFTRIVEQMIKAAPKVDQHLQDNILELISSKWGIVSLSANSLNELMWAHYGDSHKGIMIGFDGRGSLFSSPTYLCCDYVDKPAEYDPSVADGRDQVEQFARRKRSQWKYEDEHRLVIPLRECRTQTNGTVVLHLFKIEPTLITSVTFGIRTSEALKKDVAHALERPELNHVLRWQVVEGKTPGDFQRSQLA